jgi:poly(3-hydroxybutyrate) depolymerase
MRRTRPWFVAVLLLGLASAEAKPPKAPTVVEVEEGELLRLHLEGDPAAQGWLHRPKGTEAPTAEDPVDLVVVLHGAGGTPKTLFFPEVMRRRRAWCLGVAGHEAVTHDQGSGFMWHGTDVDTIVALTQHLLAKHPLRKERVLVWGHSAGGSMTLESLAKAPALFAGGLTTAAPRTPESRHQDQRVAVLMGTTDPNWAGAPAIRAYLEGLAKKKAKGACAFLAVEGLGHNVPDEAYLELGLDWVLAKGARGGEARVPLRAVGRDGPWRHIHLKPKGAAGAADGAPGRKAALELLRKVKKEVEAGRAWFPFEAACHSHDASSASAGGGVTEEALKAFVDPLPEVAPGALSEVLDLPGGVGLLQRAPAAAK